MQNKFLVTIVDAKEYFKYTPGCVAGTRQTQAFGRPQVHTEARHRRFDGLQTDLEWMTKLDGSERTATIKPVF